MKEKKEKNQDIIEKKVSVTRADEKENFIQKVQDYVDNNRNKVIYISSAVIVLVIIIFVGKNYLENKAAENRDKAETAISRIYPYFEAGEYSKALYGDSVKKMRGQDIIGLVEIINKYSSTDQAKYGALLAGYCFISLDKSNDAIKYFEIALDSKSNTVKEGANAGLANSYEIGGKYKEACGYYEKASELAVSTGNKYKYLYFQALCENKSGDKQSAEKLLRMVITNNKSKYVGPAKSELLRIGTIIE